MEYSLRGSGSAAFEFGIPRKDHSTLWRPNAAGSTPYKSSSSPRLSYSPHSIFSSHSQLRSPEFLHKKEPFMAKRGLFVLLLILLIIILYINTARWMDQISFIITLQIFDTFSLPSVLLQIAGLLNGNLSTTSNWRCCGVRPGTYPRIVLKIASFGKSFILILPLNTGVFQIFPHQIPPHGVLDAS